MSEFTDKIKYISVYVLDHITINLWKEYANEHFYLIARELKERNLSFRKEEPPSSSVQSGPSTAHVEEQYRKMFISTKKSLRKDLPEEIENVVKTKLEVSLKNASDHHVHFLFIVNSIAIVLKTLTFVDNNGDLSLETSCGYNVLQVLPDKFIRKNDIKPSPTSTVTDKEADIELDLFDVTKPDNESSRSRIKSLKSMTKHLLFSLEGPTAVGDIQKEIPDATEKEVTTVNLLIQTLKPYIPDKKNRFVIDYQLPFCLLANDILHITGYTKFTRSLFPTPRPTKLQALEINAIIIISDVNIRA
ncbi:hypothetical protein EDC94DRAFT_587675 [Helicostylum pulchrum]|nr:hypothetical protein EDC94DRAFT_587675 [Helicostylum pulchrum]